MLLATELAPHELTTINVVTEQLVRSFVIFTVIDQIDCATVIDSIDYLIRRYSPELLLKIRLITIADSDNSM